MDANAAFGIGFSILMDFCSTDTNIDTLYFPMEEVEVQLPPTIQQVRPDDPNR